jgi:hypothetical protein
LRCSGIFRKKYRPAVDSTEKTLVLQVNNYFRKGIDNGAKIYLDNSEAGKAPNIYA